MKQTLGYAIFTLVFASSGFAASCGTIDSPTACSITVGGTNIFTVTDFTLVNATGSGGGNVYQAGDSISTSPREAGSSMLLTFSKHNGSPTPGIVFLANPGNTSGFIFSYTVTLTTAVPGTAEFATPATVAFPLSSASGNGVSSGQMIISDGTTGESCLALRNSGGASQGNCNTLPPAVTNFLEVGNLVTLSGNTGNTSISGVSNLFTSTFTADPGPSVPEPSTVVLLTAGLAAFALFRRSNHS